MSLIYSLEGAEDDTESLALVQYLDLKEEAAKVGNYDELHEKVDDLVEEEKAADETSNDSEPSTDEEEDTSLEDQPPEEESDDPEPEATDESKDPEAEDTDEGMLETDGKKQTIASESLRNEYYDRIVLESFDIGESLGRAATFGKEAVVGAGLLMSQLIQALFALGIKYYPSVAKYVKKAVLYLFTRSVRSLLKATGAVTELIKKHRFSLTRRLNDIKKLREEIASLKSKAEEAGSSLVKLKTSLTDEKLISWMTVSGKTDPQLSLSVMEKFVNEVVQQVDKGFLNDIGSVERIINLNKSTASGNPLSFMEVAPFSGNFMKKATALDDDFTDSYTYSTVLPDQVLFIATLPKAGLKDIEMISKAYHGSSVFLTSDNRHPPAVESIDYMELEGVERFLDGLEALCSNAVSHISLYSKAVKSCEGLKFGYRHYFQRLTSGEEGKGVQDTLVEYVYLKQSFATRVYLPAAMDIRDYTASYLIRGIKLVKEHLKNLQVENKESAA